MITAELEHRLVRGARILEGLDEAIEGTSDCGRLIYGYDKMVERLKQRDGMSYADAVEWIDYNILGGKVGNGFIVMQAITEEEGTG